MRRTKPSQGSVTAFQRASALIVSLKQLFSSHSVPTSHSQLLAACTHMYISPRGHFICGGNIQHHLPPPSKMLTKLQVMCVYLVRWSETRCVERNKKVFNSHKIVVVRGKIKQLPANFSTPGGRKSKCNYLEFSLVLVDPLNKF